MTCLGQVRLGINMFVLKGWGFGWDRRVLINFGGGGSSVA